VDTKLQLLDASVTLAFSTGETGSGSPKAPDRPAQ